MATARELHTATVLGTGKVLVAGGYNGSNDVSSAELYDPTTNTWSAAGSMATARESHTATVLGSGKVLVAGGSTGSGYTNSAEVYDPTTNSWSAAASMATARLGQTATLLGTGWVLVAGGFNSSSGYLSSAELYDPTTNSWSAAGSMANARASHTATLLGTGKVLVAAGSNAHALSSAELYDATLPPTSTPTDTSTPTPTETPSATFTATTTETATQTMTGTATTTATAVDTATVTATSTSTPTDTPTVTPTFTSTPTFAAGCPASPAMTCDTAGKNKLLAKNGPNAKLGWHWGNGVAAVTQGDFGNPVSGGTSYRFCLYDESSGAPVLKVGATIPAGATCGSVPCWKALGTSGWSYKDKLGAHGISQLLLKGGTAGKPLVKFKGGAGGTLPNPISLTQFFAEDPAVIVQLYSSSSANCWSSTFDASSTKANSGTVFKAKTP
jgi:hypothetical protein